MDVPSIITGNMHTSWWEGAWLDADVVVVGGGIVGMSAALSLHDRRPRASIVVLERGMMPTGASTRNAGFACFGSVSEIVHDIALMGADAAATLVEERWRGLALLRARCGDAAMDYVEDGGHEVFVDDHPALDAIGDVNRLLQPVFGGGAFERRDDLLADHGFTAAVRHLVRTPFEGTIHSGRTMARLWALAQERGIRVAGGATVGAVTDGANGVHLAVADPLGAARTIRARQVVVATNALAPDIMGADVVPGRGQIVVSEPIPGLRLRGSYHYDEGYVYFRPVDGNRLLIGGGRNMAMDQERTVELETTPLIMDYLADVVGRVLAIPQPLVPSVSWAGIMGFSADKKPRVDHRSPNVIRAFGCNGMGVALGTTIGERAARLLVDGVA